MNTHEKEELKCGNCSCVFQIKDHFSSHKKKLCWCTCWISTNILPLNDLCSNNNNGIEQGDIENEVDNSTEESINTECNEEIETV